MATMLCYVKELENPRYGGKERRVRLREIVL